MLTKSDFINDTQLAIGQYHEEAFDLFLVKEEAECLRRVLGIVLKASYEAGIAAATPDQKWIDLRDGAVYDTDYYFHGLKEIVRYYCYVKWIQVQTINSGSMNILPKAENSNVVYPVGEVTRANNICLNYCDELYNFIAANESDYTGFIFGYPFESRFNVFGI